MNTKQISPSQPDAIPDSADCPSLLVNARQAGQLVGVSLRTWRSWNSAGHVPLPVRIGRMVFWRRDDLVAWLAAGCPRRRDPGKRP